MKRNILPAIMVFIFTLFMVVPTFAQTMDDERTRSPEGSFSGESSEEMGQAEVSQGQQCWHCQASLPATPF